MTIWNQARKISGKAVINDKGFEYCIYKGIRVTHNNEIFTYGQEHRLHEAPSWVYQMAERVGVKKALHELVKFGYKKSLEIVEAKIKLEIATNNNHKRLTYLKDYRKYCLIKYSEL